MPRTIIWLISALLLSTLLSVYYFIDINLLLPHSSVANLEDSSHAKPVNSTSPEPAKVLLVSAYFPLSKSKEVFAEHMKSLSFFLAPIKTDIYFFTPPEMEQQVRTLRGGLPIVVNTSFASLFDTAPMSPYKDSYTEMYKKDREKTVHSPRTYAIRNNKPFFLEQGLLNSLSEKHYDYAFWIDPLSFDRPHAYHFWPDPARLDATWQQGSDSSGSKKENIVFVPMSNPPHPTMRFWSEAMGPIANDFSHSSLFGGKLSAVSWYKSVFYAYHNAYISPARGPHFVGKDESVMNAIMLLFPERFITVWAKNPNPQLVDEAYPTDHLPSELPLGTCGNPSTFYQFFLASSPARDIMIENFKTDTSIWHNWPWKWKPMEWFHHRNNCQLPKTLGMIYVLKNTFGKGWQSPDSSI